MRKFGLVFALVLIVVLAAFAEDVAVPYTFESGTPALASQVNENFDTLETAINEQIALTMGLNATTVANGDMLSYDGANWVAVPPSTEFYQTVSTVQPFLVIRYIIALQGVFPARAGMDPYIAEIGMFAGNFPPRGWAFCDGQLLPIAQNAALFSLVGTMYGGDGRTTFALPDLRGRVPMHAGNGPGLTPRSQGERGGSETAPIIR